MLSPGRHAVNTTLRLAVQFTNDDYTDVDPTTVTLKIYSPDGDTTTYVYGTNAELERDDTGDYFCDYVPDVAGRWNYRWESTGDGTAVAVEGQFVVQASAFYDVSSRKYQL